MTSRTHLGPAFEDAVRYAVVAHAGQKRKDTEIPYATHLLAVSASVLEAGGTEVRAIAGLLHDVAEDCGGQPRLNDVRLRFGDEVGDIVEGCSDSLVEDAAKKTRGKTQRRICHITEAPPEVLLVSLADKLHNATSILRDLRDVGVDVFVLRLRRRHGRVLQPTRRRVRRTDRDAHPRRTRVSE